MIVKFIIIGIMLILLVGIISAFIIFFIIKKNKSKFDGFFIISDSAIRTDILSNEFLLKEYEKDKENMHPKLLEEINIRELLNKKEDE